MFGMHCVEHFVEVRATEVCCRLQSGEYAATRHSLEMFFADVLQNKFKIKKISIPTCTYGQRLNQTHTQYCFAINLIRILFNFLFASCPYYLCFSCCAAATPLVHKVPNSIPLISCRPTTFNLLYKFTIYRSNGGSEFISIMSRSNAINSIAALNILLFNFILRLYRY